MRDYNAFTENNVSQPGAGRARSEGKWEVMRSRDFLLDAGIGLFGALARTSNTAVPGGPQAAPSAGAATSTRAEQAICAASSALQPAK
jgi:hypothetical protein